MSSLTLICDAAQPEPPPHPGRKASKPFNRDDADLVIRSSDNIEFHVHRIILALASPVFADMFTIPQPPGIGSERPMVDVSEDSEALDVLLRICYPEPVPQLPSLDLLHRVLGAAMKYDMRTAIELAKDAMVQPHFLHVDPLHVFVTACRLGLEDEAGIAARTVVEMGRVEGLLCPGLDDISAGAYYRLLELDRAAIPSPIRSGVPLTRSIPAGATASIGPFCGPSKRADPVRRESLRSLDPRFDTTSDVGLIIRSCDLVEFRLSRAVIAMHSVSTLLGRVPATTELLEDEENLPPIRVMAEDSIVVDALLRLCLPSSYEQPRDLDLFLDVLSASRKYALPDVEAPIRRFWPPIMNTDPLRLYIAAMRYGWVAEAQLCARALCKVTTFPPYTPAIFRSSRR